LPQPLKQAAVERLLAGEITLLEAARYFRYANRHPQASLADLPKVLPTAPEDPHHCHEVIAWVGHFLAQGHDPNRELIVADLLQEMNTHLQKMALPPTPPIPPEGRPRAP
jgi:hypothetical protein